jgi:hypothetical protein
MYLPIYFAIIAALSVVLYPLSFDGIDAQISDMFEYDESGNDDNVWI